MVPRCIVTSVAKCEGLLLKSFSSLRLHCYTHKAAHPDHEFSTHTRCCLKYSLFLLYLGPWWPEVEPPVESAELVLPEQLRELHPVLPALRVPLPGVLHRLPRGLSGNRAATITSVGTFSNHRGLFTCGAPKSQKSGADAKNFHRAKDK